MIIDRRKLELQQARASLSREELMQAANITVGAWNGLGIRNTTPKTVGKLAAALGCDVLDIIADRKED